MIAGSDRGGAEREGGVQEFAVAKCHWASPDRLGIEGRFVGSGEPPDGEYVLVLHGPDGEQRIRATDRQAGDDGSWSAVFVWDTPPIAFETAELEVGDAATIVLSNALAGDGSQEPQELELRRASPATSNGADGSPPEDSLEQLRRETDLIAARQELSEQRTAGERTSAELERAEADLRAERDARTAEGERFRESLAAVRESAERAIADAGQQQEARTAELREALEAADRELTELRAHVDRLTGVASLATEAREDAEQLLGRLTDLVDTLQDTREPDGP
jgi:hypothetical protein